ncbi:hypothetical protein L7F22_040646 [Adiantum nelumboides]|nr:hypothetical protein [Adiantum nelumboides]
MPDSEVFTVFLIIFFMLLQLQEQITALLHRLRVMSSFLAYVISSRSFFNMDDGQEMFFVSLGFIGAMSHCLLDSPNVRWQDPTHGAWYVKPRSLHWWPNYELWCAEENNRFREFFRLPQALFDQLEELLHDFLVQGDIPAPLLRVRGRAFNVDRKIAVALMRLATGATYRTISELFGCGMSTVGKIVDAFVDALLQHINQFIKWPSTPMEMQAVKVGMERAQGFPNCCGAIDCTHIQMEAPQNELSSDWYDRKGHYSMTLQGIVDSTMRFCDIYVGFPGPENDKRVLQNSSFFRLAQACQILNGRSFIGRGYNIREYIIGDGGYYELPWLLIPYQTPSLTIQKVYNRRLSSTRMVVERAFGRLKTTWRILHGVIQNPDINKIPKLIAACCILHNLAIDHGLAIGDVLDPTLAIYDQVEIHELNPLNAISMDAVAMYLHEIHGQEQA